MVKVYRLYVVILAALALCKYSLAEWNATDGSANPAVPGCHLHGNKDNCTETEQWNGHYSECPKELMYYCVHGECRYIKEQNTPSCRCQSQYIGARCEYVDLGWQIGEKQHIVIGIIAALVLLMALIILICICSHRRSRLCWQRRRQSEEARDGTEKLSMMDTREKHTASTADPTEQTDFTSVIEPPIESSCTGSPETR